MTSSGSESSDCDSAHTLDSPPTSPLREGPNSNELDPKTLFSPYRDLLALLNEFESAGYDWGRLSKTRPAQDAAHLRLNILDLLKLVDMHRSLAYIELGWHLSVLEGQVLPAMRQYQSLHKQCSQAFKALNRDATLTNIVNLAYQMPQDTIIHLRAKYEAALAAHRAYEIIGQSYCNNPVPLFSGEPQEYVDMGAYRQHGQL